MLNYAQVRQESYYAQNYAGIMCQGLATGRAIWLCIRTARGWVSMQNMYIIIDSALRKMSSVRFPGLKPHPVLTRLVENT